MKHALLGLALTLAMPALAQTAPELSDLDPNKLPPAPVDSAAHDLTLPGLYTSAEPDREVNGCIVPGRPDWLVEMNPATTNERALVNAMYQHRWSTTVVAQEDCACALRYPDWADVIAKFEENYAGLDRAAMSDVRHRYNGEHHQYIARARAICREHNR